MGNPSFHKNKETQLFSSSLSSCDISRSQEGTKIQAELVQLGLPKGRPRNYSL